MRLPIRPPRASSTTDGRETSLLANDRFYDLTASQLSQPIISTGLPDALFGESRARQQIL
jgi:hypothetical protein